jgi:hypothetical protein
MGFRGLFLHFLFRERKQRKTGGSKIASKQMAGPPIALFAAIPPRRNEYSKPFLLRLHEEISLHINPGRSLDRNGVDDGIGATAAIGATDIRPHVDSSGIGHHHSNKVCIVGIRGQCKRESHRLLWTHRVPR